MLPVIWDSIYSTFYVKYLFIRQFYSFSVQVSIYYITTSCSEEYLFNYLYGDWFIQSIWLHSLKTVVQISIIKAV